MHIFLQKYSNFYLEHILTAQEREAIFDDIYCVFIKNYAINYCSYLKLSKFFTKTEKLLRFIEFTNLKTYIESLKIKILSLTHDRPEEKSHFSITQTSELYQDGIEMFRLRNEAIHGFAIDSCDSGNLGMALSRGSREINVKHTLLYRGRTQNGFKILDEELNTWEECAHRYDNLLSVDEIRDNYSSSFNAVQGAISNLFNANENNVKRAFLPFQPNPPPEWNGRAYPEFLRVFSNSVNVILIAQIHTANES
jgi:hypothetical protein